MSLRPATEADSHLIPYDNTKLSAYNTCPTYGVVRFAMHKRNETHSRAMALEAGVAMHDVFALVRLVTLARQLHHTYDWDAADINDLMNREGCRLFGTERWTYICTQSPQNEDDIGRLKHDALEVLETSGFYDDDRDKRRTLSNLQECALAYIDRWDFAPVVWCRDYSDPKTDTGIEIAFDLVVSVDGQDVCRFTGKLDGIRSRNGRLVVEDNKTASRLNDAWEMSFATSHQLTGYCTAASVFTGGPVLHAEAIGLAIPLPRSEFNGYMRVPVTRIPEQFERWAGWFLHTVRGYEQHTDPHSAPLYTHSCNRYFRPCYLIPFCAQDREEQERIMEEMIVDEWSPLHKIDDTGE